MRSVNRSATILAVLLIVAPFLAPGIARADNSLPEARNQAARLFEQGAYAQAKQVLHTALAAEAVAPESAEAQKARALLERANDALEDSYLAQEAATKRAVDEQAKRAAAA